MTGKMSPDGKTVEFELKDISGSTEEHMQPFGVHHHRRQTIHTEDWTFMMKDKPIPRALRPEAGTVTPPCEPNGAFALLRGRRPHLRLHPQRGRADEFHQQPRQIRGLAVSTHLK